MSILHQQGHPRRHPGHHRQDRSVFHTLQMPASTPTASNCFVAGVNPKKAGEKLQRGIPIFGTRQGSKAAQTGVNASVIYVPPAGCRRRHLGGGGGRSRPGDLHHRRHSCARHGGSARPHEGQARTPAASRRSCSARTARGVITPDEIKIGIMPGHIHMQGPHRRGVAFRHPDLRGGRRSSATSDWGRSSAVGIGGDPDERPQAQGGAGTAFNERPGHGCGDHDRRDRRSRTRPSCRDTGTPTSAGT